MTVTADRPTLTLVPELPPAPPITTVYTKPQCFQCDKTKQKFTEAGVPFEVVDITEDPQALAALKSLGYMQAPVVFTTVPGHPDDHWGGLNPKKITEVIDRWRESQQAA